MSSFTVVVEYGLGRIEWFSLEWESLLLDSHLRLCVVDSGPKSACLNNLHYQLIFECCWLFDRLIIRVWFRVDWQHFGGWHSQDTDCPCWAWQWPDSTVQRQSWISDHHCWTLLYRYSILWLLCPSALLDVFLVNVVAFRCYCVSK